MEFKELMAARRSVRRFSDRAVPREVVDRILAEALTAPSSRNSRSTRFLVVDRHDLIARMAGMRDYGSAFMEGAPLAVVVLGDTAVSDLWSERRDFGHGAATGLRGRGARLVLGPCGRPSPPQGRSRGGAGRGLPADVPADSRRVRAALRRRAGLFGFPARAATRRGRRGADYPAVMR